MLIINTIYNICFRWFVNFVENELENNKEFIYFTS
jgi:hypothetical protein